MKVTNISRVEMRVRAIDGVVSIPAGKSVNVAFSPELLEQARRRQFLVVDESTELSDLAPEKPKSKRKEA